MKNEELPNVVPHLMAGPLQAIPKAFHLQNPRNLTLNQSPKFQYFENESKSS